MFDYNIRILVMDSLPVMRKILVRSLQDIGFKVIEEAENGLDAVEKISSGNFGLIIADWNTPGLGGVELVRVVRKDPFLRVTPFILTSLTIDKRRVMTALGAGADNYIVKPITTDTLKMYIKKALDKYAKPTALSEANGVMT